MVNHYQQKIVNSKVKCYVKIKKKEYIWKGS